LRKLAKPLEFTNKNVREQERKLLGCSSLSAMHRILRLHSRIGNRQPDVSDHISSSLRVPHLTLSGTRVAPPAWSVTRHAMLDSETASAFVKIESLMRH
jgi:hypothetical protein